MALTAVGKLNYRLMDALGGFDVTPEERDRVIKAWTAAGGEMSATWEKLPLGVQHLVAEIEKRDPQSWDDPADLPEQQGI
jgi:hypothetical protein